MIMIPNEQETEHFVLYSNSALNGTDGTIDIAFMINDGRIFYLDTTYLSAETPFYMHPTASVQDQASAFLDRYVNYYDTYSGASNIEDLRSLINTYGMVGPVNQGIGNSTMEVIAWPRYPDNHYTTLVRAPKGISNTYDNIVLSYNRGVLNQFIDLWDRMPVGSFDVNLNETQAVQIAEKATGSYSIAYDNVTLSNFTLSKVNNAVMTELEMQPRNGSLYPMYTVSLGLNRMYAGGITELQVGVWADTGQVVGTNYVSNYGGPFQAPAQSLLLLRRVQSHQRQPTPTLPLP